MVCDLVLTCALWLGTAQPTLDGTSLQRLRTTEPLVRTAIEDGQRRSPTFASLVDMIERSGTFVYVTRAHMLPHRMEGCVVPSGSRTGHLRVLLAMGPGKDQTIIVLAHELQHVREILEAGRGHDQAAFDALFSQIGARQQGSSTAEQYETAGAQAVMRTVDRELREHTTVRRRPN